MQEFLFWIYIIVTSPVWLVITGIWIVIKGMFFLLIFFVSVFLSIFSKTFSLWNIFGGFITTIQRTFEDADIILKWFKEFYYESPFLAFILGLLCFYIFWQMSSPKRN